MRCRLAMHRDAQVRYHNWNVCQSMMTPFPATRAQHSTESNVPHQPLEAPARPMTGVQSKHLFLILCCFESAREQYKLYILAQVCGMGTTTTHYFCATDCGDPSTARIVVTCKPMYRTFLITFVASTLPVLSCASSSCKLAVTLYIC